MVDNIIASDFELLPSYPNPFNPITSINFTLLNDSEVSIEIYNLNGERVVYLANDIYSAGYHNIVWNANDQSTGIYFVKMISGEFMSTQKLMLIK